MADPTSPNRFTSRSPSGRVLKAASHSEPEPGSAELKRKLLDDMSVKDMMKYLAENFEEVLGDLSEASGNTLEAQLVRAWECREWGTLTTEINAHTMLLGSMCPVLCAAGQDKHRKKLLDASGDKIEEGVKYIMRKLDHMARGQLDQAERDALKNMIGERLRAHILTLPSKKRTEKHINLWFGPCFNNVKLIDRASWDEMLRLVLTRTDEPLSYLDLKKQNASASDASAQASAADKNSGVKKAKEPEAKDDSDDSELDENDVTGARYHKQKCTVS